MSAKTSDGKTQQPEDAIEQRKGLNVILALAVLQFSPLYELRT